MNDYRFGKFSSVVADSKRSKHILTSNKTNSESNQIGIHLVQLDRSSLNDITCCMRVIYSGERVKEHLREPSVRFARSHLPLGVTRFAFYELY